MLCEKLSAMGRGKGVLVGVALVASLAVALGMGGSGNGADGIWPDSRVGALWPTFLSLPAPESGGGGLAEWNGSFWGCVPSPRVSTDFACEYTDELGRVGYACVGAAAFGAPISAGVVDARVAPGDTTYGSEEPTKVCLSALAYRLSLG
jgi:hypothetical protein